MISFLAVYLQLRFFPVLANCRDAGSAVQLLEIASNMVCQDRPDDGFTGQQEIMEPQRLKFSSDWHYLEKKKKRPRVISNSQLNRDTIVQTR